MVVVLGIIGGGAWFLFQPVPKPEDVVIGAIMPITGLGKEGGLEVQNGLRMAVDEVNAAGGINGARVVLVVQDDDGLDQEKTEQLLLDMNRTHHPIVVISAVRPSVNMIPLADKHQILNLALILTVSPDYLKDRHWGFRMYWSTQDEVPPLVEHIRKLGIRKLNMLYIGGEVSFGNDMAKGVHKLIKAEGGSVLASASFSNLLTETETFSKFLKESPPADAYFFVGFPNHIELFLKAYRQAGLKQPILGTSNIALPAVRALPDAAEGIYTSAPAIYNSKFIFAREVSEKYQQRFGQALSHYAGKGYDAVHLIHDLLVGEQMTSQVLRDKLESDFNFNSLFGEIIHPAGEHDITHRLLPAMLKDGEVIY